MSDDDRTLDADDAMLDDLRRMAAEARSSMDDDSDVTVGADDSAMDELRRFAEEARASESDDDIALPEVQEREVVDDFEDIESRATDLSDAVDRKDSDTIPLIDIPDIEPPPATGASPRRLADVPDYVSTELRASAERPADGDEATQLRGGSEIPIDVAAPPPIERGEGWRPPPRMTMPSEPEAKPSAGAGPWKFVAAGLGAALVVVFAIFIIGALSGDDTPSDDQVPADEVVENLDPDDRSGAGG